MKSDFLGAILFLALMVALIILHMSTPVEVIQCPGALATRASTLSGINKRAKLKINTTKCHNSVMTLNELYELRRLQKELYAR
jgi:hypothetical protein